LGELKTLPLDVEICALSDGYATFYRKKVVYNGEEDSPIKGKIIGNIAVVCGQGRKIDLDEVGVTGLLCSLLASAFPKKKNKFFKYFRWKTCKMFSMLKSLGMKVHGSETVYEK